ncbi:MAG: protein-glutamate O-methyltransferase CheR [Nitrospirae bacterium]|nr:protein-glutamate O-methyltransferase CheR [Magnetococcales bacterium]HAT49904.1 chemotaxis protein [Alphaproteobacteria bacterium]
MAISKEEFLLIRTFLHDHSGILIGDGKEYLVENRLTVLMVQNGCENFFDLHKKLQKDTGPLRNKVIDAMTTNETLWFRDASFAAVVSEAVLPQLVAKAATQTVRIWSAACSTGQEPYSIGILLHEEIKKLGAKGPPVSKFKILATDISPSAIMIAKTARYSQLAISRGMKPELLEKYFTKNGMVHEVKPEVRSLVEFKQFNLKDDFEQHGMFDFVMCRNVLIYFSEDLKRDIYRKIHRGLLKDGWLAIGASESPRGYTDVFEQVIIKGAALFRPKGVSKGA